MIVATRQTRDTRKPERPQSGKAKRHDASKVSERVASPVSVPLSVGQLAYPNTVEH